MIHIRCKYLRVYLPLTLLQERRGDDVLDLPDKPGGGAVLCSSLSCSHRLHEEILSTHPAILVNQT